MFKIKYNLDDSIERYKVRLVVQKFFQVYRIDYTDIFIPIIRRKSLKIFLAITVMREMILIQIDVIDVYLESILSQNK